MKEDKLPSYVKLLDYYKRTKTDDTVLKDYVDIPTETQKEASLYLNRENYTKEIRKFAIYLATKNLSYGSSFSYAKNIANFIMYGDIPEDVENYTTQGFYIGENEIEEAHIKSEKELQRHLYTTRHRKVRS